MKIISKITETQTPEEFRKAVKAVAEEAVNNSQVEEILVGVEDFMRSLDLNNRYSFDDGSYQKASWILGNYVQDIRNKKAAGKDFLKQLTELIYICQSDNIEFIADPGAFINNMRDGFYKDWAEKKRREQLMRIGREVLQLFKNKME